MLLEQRLLGTAIAYVALAAGPYGDRMGMSSIPRERGFDSTLALKRDPYRFIPRRCAATYFPETNVLVPVKYFADKSHTPASKSVVISIRAAD